MNKPTASFNAYDLASTIQGLIVVATDPNKMPVRVLNTNAIASANKSATTSAYFTVKPVTIDIEIGADTREILDLRIDSLKQILQDEEATLLTSQNGTDRSYTATLSGFNIQDSKGGWAAIELVFTCADPYGYATSSTTLASSTTTGSTRTNNFLVLGSAKWQLPVTTITLTALTGGTSKAITVDNPATGQSIVISRTFTAGDVIVIDSKQRKVTVNGTEVAFTGAFPEYNPGAGQLNYSDTLTTRTVTIATTYVKRYL